MLQRVIAGVLAVLGLTSIGLAVASGTVWRPSETVTAAASPDDATTLLITEPGVLELVGESVTVNAVRADGGPVVLAIGREPDVLGWVGEDAHGLITGMSSWTTLATTFVDGSTVAVEPGKEDSPNKDKASEGDEDSASEETATEDADPQELDESPAAEGDTAATDGVESDDAASGLVGPDPSGSDMWLESVSEEGQVTLDWTAPKGRSILLVANTGDDAPPPAVTLTWEREVSTPLVVPGVVVGVLLLLAAVFLFLRGARRRVGPDTVSRRRPRVEAAPSGAAMDPVATPGRGGPGVPTPVGPITTSPIGAADEATDDQQETTDAQGGGAPVGVSEPSRPMSRREMREMAEREAAELAQERRTRRGTRRQREPGTETGAVRAAGSDHPADPVGSGGSTRSGHSALSARSGRSARSAVSAATGAIPVAKDPKEDPAVQQTGPRADAWRKAWGFQHNWDPKSDSEDSGTEPEGADPQEERR